VSVILEVQNTITEQQFENTIRGAGLSEVEREALRKYYGLSCNENLLSFYTKWEDYAAAAWRKIVRVNPTLCRRLQGCY